MVNMDWFFREQKNFMDFARIMKNKPDDLYVSEFVTYTLDQFWPPLKRQIIYRLVIPHIITTIVTILNSFIALHHSSLEKSLEDHKITIYILSILQFICILNAIRVEVNQFINQEKKTHYCTLWNFVDIMSIISSALFVVCIFT